MEGGRLTGGVQLLLVLTHQGAALDILTCKQVIISMCCTRTGHRQQERRVIVEVHPCDDDEHMPEPVILTAWLDMGILYAELH